MRFILPVIIYNKHNKFHEMIMTGESKVVTLKRKVFNVEHHLCRCKAEVRDSRILLLYSVYPVL